MQILPRRDWCSISGAAAAMTALMALASCSREAPSGAHSLHVVATIAPLAGIVRPLLPEGSDLVIMIPPGKSEHGYEMTAADVSSLARADLVVTVGLGLDGQVAVYLKGHPAPKRTELVFADAAGVAPSPGQPHHDDHPAAAGGDDDDDEHGGVDPHLWLDPALVAKSLPTVESAVEHALSTAGMTGPDEPRRMESAKQRLADEVSRVDSDYRTRLAPFAGRSIVTHHAAWGRLAERYGLKVAAVIRPIEGSEPTAAAVSAAVHAIEDQHVTAIFVEPQFSAQAAERIAALAHVHVATLDPLGTGDWSAMMLKNLDSLTSNLGPATPPPAGTQNPAH